MNCIMSFTKDVKFESSCAQIASISLEHEYNVNEKIILGNFFVEGSYKPHELSVNTEEFSFTLPFDVSLPDNIISNTVVFNIDNFTYEIVSENTLKIDIDYIVKGEEEVEKKDVFEEEPNDFSNLFEERLENSEDSLPEEIVPEVNEEQEKRIDEVSMNTILNFASENEETFVTYHIHIMKEEDTLDNISKVYNKNETEILEYNKNIKFLTGDKILIPLDE